MILLALAMQAAGPAPVAIGAGTNDERYARCTAAIGTDAVARERRAEAWQAAGGGWQARQCLGLALTAQGRFTAAADAFTAAARGAETARSDRAARLWAQAGNAWLAAAAPAKARAALDAALAAGSLVGFDRGEALLDRARALVAAGEAVQARADLDAALMVAADDPLAWLLSATLARRAGDLARAKADIAGALARSADDASVQLEAGNIAAADGDAATAQAAWREAARLAPDAAAGKAATTALAQFGAAQGS